MFHLTLIIPPKIPWIIHHKAMMQATYHLGNIKCLMREDAMKLNSIIQLCVWKNIFCFQLTTHYNCYLFIYDFMRTSDVFHCGIAIVFLSPAVNDDDAKRSYDHLYCIMCKTHTHSNAHSLRNRAKWIYGRWQTDTLYSVCVCVLSTRTLFPLLLT